MRTVPATDLPRKLGLAHSIFLVVGSVFGSGIFLTTGIMAASLPSPGLIFLCSFLGGVYAFVGLLTRWPSPRFICRRISFILFLFRWRA